MIPAPPTSERRNKPAAVPVSDAHHDGRIDAHVVSIFLRLGGVHNPATDPASTHTVGGSKTAQRPHQDYIVARPLLMAGAHRIGRTPADIERGLSILAERDAQAASATAAERDVKEAVSAACEQSQQQRDEVRAKAVQAQRFGRGGHKSPALPPQEHVSLRTFMRLLELFEAMDDERAASRDRRITANLHRAKERYVAAHRERAAAIPEPLDRDLLFFDEPLPQQRASPHRLFSPVAPAPRPATATAETPRYQRLHHSGAAPSGLAHTTTELERHVRRARDNQRNEEPQELRPRPGVPSDVAFVALRGLEDIIKGRRHSQRYRGSPRGRSGPAGGVPITATSGAPASPQSHGRQPEQPASPPVRLRMRKEASHKRTYDLVNAADSERLDMAVIVPDLRPLAPNASASSHAARQLFASPGASGRPVLWFEQLQLQRFNPHHHTLAALTVIQAFLSGRRSGAIAAVLHALQLQKRPLQQQQKGGVVVASGGGRSPVRQPMPWLTPHPPPPSLKTAMQVSADGLQEFYEKSGTGTAASRQTPLYRTPITHTYHYFQWRSHPRQQTNALRRKVAADGDEGLSPVERRRRDQIRKEAAAATIYTFLTEHAARWKLRWRQQKAKRIEQRRLRAERITTVQAIAKARVAERYVAWLVEQRRLHAAATAIQRVVRGRLARMRLSKRQYAAEQECERRIQHEALVRSVRLAQGLLRIRRARQDVRMRQKQLVLLWDLRNKRDDRAWAQEVLRRFARSAIARWRRNVRALKVSRAVEHRVLAERIEGAKKTIARFARFALARLRLSRHSEGVRELTETRVRAERSEHAVAIVAAFIRARQSTKETAARRTAHVEHSARRVAQFFLKHHLKLRLRHVHNAVRCAERDAALRSCDERVAAERRVERVVELQAHLRGLASAVIASESTVRRVVEEAITDAVNARAAEIIACMDGIVDARDGVDVAELSTVSAAQSEPSATRSMPREITTAMGTSSCAAVVPAEVSTTGRGSAPALEGSQLGGSQLEGSQLGGSQLVGSQRRGSLVRSLVEEAIMHAVAAVVHSHTASRAASTAPNSRSVSVCHGYETPTPSVSMRGATPELSGGFAAIAPVPALPAVLALPETEAAAAPAPGNQTPSLSSTARLRPLAAEVVHSAIDDAAAHRRPSSSQASAVHEDRDHQGALVGALVASAIEAALQGHRQRRVSSGSQVEPLAHSTRSEALSTSSSWRDHPEIVQSAVRDFVADVVGNMK